MQIRFSRLCASGMVQVQHFWYILNKTYIHKIATSFLVHIFTKKGPKAMCRRVQCRRVQYSVGVFKLSDSIWYSFLKRFILKRCCFYSCFEPPLMSINFVLSLQSKQGNFTCSKILLLVFAKNTLTVKPLYIKRFFQILCNSLSWYDSKLWSCRFMQLLKTLQMLFWVVPVLKINSDHRGVAVSHQIVLGFKTKTPNRTYCKTVGVISRFSHFQYMKKFLIETKTVSLFFFLQFIWDFNKIQHLRNILWEYKRCKRE